jgi:hypothetical protein
MVFEMADVGDDALESGRAAVSALVERQAASVVTDLDATLDHNDDELGTGGVISYRYRGQDPNQRVNVGLRTASVRTQMRARHRAKFRKKSAP